MKLLVLMSVLLLSSCGDITQKDLELAIAYCEDKEGIYKISILSKGAIHFVHCKNGDSVKSNYIDNQRRTEQ